MLTHPDARDTLDGIDKWWLPQARSYTLADIITALQSLIRLDLMRKWQSSSSSEIYGRKTEDSAPVEEYLRLLE